MTVRSTVIRSTFLAVSTVVGLMLAALVGWAQFQWRGPFARDSFASMSWVLGMTTAFILGVYWTGELCYRIHGDDQEAATIGANRRIRMLLINLVAIPIFIASWFAPN